MPDVTLVIGNKNYSSWSLRAWLVLRASGVAFEELQIPLGRADSPAEILRYSAAGLVPVLVWDDTFVWDSLAIAEHLAERAPTAQLWPEDPDARAVARSVSAEMHAGFRALREHMPYNARRPTRAIKVPPEVRVDIDRISRCWRDCRAQFGASGPFLFGRWSIADAMYAPVVKRFRIYDVELDEEAKAYCDAVSELPAVREWEAQALDETWVIEHEER
jgi:glutathione S-transferase